MTTSLKTWALAATTVLLTGVALSACGAAESGAAPSLSPEEIARGLEAGELAKATFAGGCFWCMEPPFDKLEGVVATISGYTAGHQKNPTYKQVSSGSTGHTEAVEVIFDPSKIGYATLLDVFWRNIDPVAVNRQFCDGGSQYRSGIYTHDEEQQRLAEATKKTHEESGRFDQPIATEIEAATDFYPAEDYHQDYYLKNPTRYKWYRQGCGRDRRLAELWGE